MIKVAILMQGSDFINVSVVPAYDVNQFDLGDVFISPCRAGTYNEARDSFCKDCSVCTDYQYEKADCIPTRNRICANCTVCTKSEQEICACRQLNGDCVTGNAVCLPLPATTANVTFDMTVSMQLNGLKERFLQEGLRTGFVLFLADYLAHDPEEIVFMYMRKTSAVTYTAGFVVNNVYSLFTKKRVELLTQDVVQTGLTNTFGVQSNTFSTVSSQRRRRLLQQVITLNAGNVETACVLQGACGRFFTMSNPETPCESTCVSLPCPPGYTGLYGICEMCPNATYKDVEGNGTCTQCPGAATSDQGSTSLSQCWVPTTQGPTTTTTTSVRVSTTTTAGNNNNTGTSTGTVLAFTSSVSVQPLESRVQSTTATSRQTTTSGVSVATTTTAAIVPLTTPAPPSGGGGGGGGGVWVNNLTVFQRFVTFTQNVQYITIHTRSLGYTGNASAADLFYYQVTERCVGFLVAFVMTAGLIAIGFVGTRLFMYLGDTGGYVRVPRREIPIKIVAPPHSHDDDDDHDSASGDDGDPAAKNNKNNNDNNKVNDKNKQGDPHEFHFNIPRSVFLGGGGAGGGQQQRRRSRSVEKEL